MRPILRVESAAISTVQVGSELKSNGDCPCFADATYFRGNHSSITTCLTQAFFKSGGQCGKFLLSLTRRNTHKTNEAVLDK